MSVPVGVLVSGSGTNLGALIEATAAPDFPAHIAVVISNRKGAYALERAAAAGVPGLFLPHRVHPSREAYDHELVQTLRAHAVQWVCLAGFMRIVTPVMLDAFPQRVLNIHPSLLPAFPGLNAQAQALEHGVKITGATVHIVDAGVDTGPILAQQAVPIHPDDDLARLKARILLAEHRLYPEALRSAVLSRPQLM